MDMHIDQTGHHQTPRRIHHLTLLGRQIRPDRRNHPVVQQEIAPLMNPPGVRQVPPLINSFIALPSQQQMQRAMRTATPS